MVGLAWLNAFVLGAGVVALVAQGLGDEPAAQAQGQAEPLGERVISVAAGTYGAETFRIDAGSVVVFENDDAEGHTFTAEGGLFDSGVVAPRTQYRWSSGSPREVRFHCEIHPRMEATLIVEAAS